MNNTFNFIAALVVLAAAIMQTQPLQAPSASASSRYSTRTTSQEAASADKTLKQSMADAKSVMHKEMGTAPYGSEPERDFVTMMIRHHQDSIDVAKALLASGTDPEMRRVAQQIIRDQQSELELMQLWLKQHDDITSNAGE